MVATTSLEWTKKLPPSEEKRCFINHLWKLYGPCCSQCCTPRLRTAVQTQKKKTPASNFMFHTRCFQAGPHFPLGKAASIKFKHNTEMLGRKKQGRAYTVFPCVFQPELCIFKTQFNTQLEQKIFFIKIIIFQEGFQTCFLLRGTGVTCKLDALTRGDGPSFRSRRLPLLGLITAAWGSA